MPKWPKCSRHGELIFWAGHKYLGLKVSHVLPGSFGSDRTAPGDLNAREHEGLPSTSDQPVQTNCSLSLLNCLACVVCYRFEGHSLPYHASLRHRAGIASPEPCARRRTTGTAQSRQGLATPRHATRRRATLPVELPTVPSPDRLVQPPCSWHSTATV